jgi:hypothetical protein
MVESLAVCSGQNKFSIYLNGERAGTQLLYHRGHSRKEGGESDSDELGTSLNLETSLLSPNTPGSRRTSISSLDTDLVRYLSQYEDFGAEENPKDDLLVDEEGIQEILGEESIMLTEQFLYRWDRLMGAFCRVETGIFQEYQRFKALARTSQLASSERLLEQLENLIKFLIAQAKAHFNEDNILKILSGDNLPQEINLIHDLNRVRMHCLHQYPINIGESDIVGAVVRKVKDKIPIHINVLCPNFLRENETMNLRDILFYICQIDGREYLLKPFKNYRADKSSRRVPQLMMFMDINYTDNKMLERNMIAFQLSEMLGLNGTVPSIKNATFREKRYMAVELKLATSLIEFSKQDRSQLYKNPYILRDLFSKQLFDCLLGNCDPNPGNILIDVNQTPYVISIDYDLSLSPAFSDIGDVFSMLGTRKSEFLRNRLSRSSHYKGVPSLIDVDLKRDLLGVNNWDYFGQLLLLNHVPSIQTNLRRLIDLKASVLDQRIRVISDWNEGFGLVKKMSARMRKSTTYLV